MARLERDLERVLEDLADDFPLLQSLVDRRAGGQKRLPMPGRGDARVPTPLFTTPAVGHESLGDSPIAPGADTGTAEHPSEAAPPSVQPPPAACSPVPPDSEHAPPGRGAMPAHEREPDGQLVAAADARETVAGRRRPARYGLLVQFESRPEDSELGRLVDSTIWINDAHPAYTRAIASRSLGYHTALAVALALAPLAVEPHEEHTFITQFLAHWGSAQATTRRTGRRRTKKSA
jgi:hypothetical protein